MEEQLAVLAGVIGGVWALLLWLSVVVWVYRDVRERTRDSSLQALSVFVVLMFFPGFNLPGLGLYLMLRPRETMEESYARSLEEEALLRELGDEGSCPSCRRLVDKDFQFCPSCQTQLKDPCPKCSRLLSFTWVACPSCGTAREGGVPSTAPVATAVEAPGSDQGPRESQDEAEEETEPATQGAEAGRSHR